MTVTDLFVRNAEAFNNKVRRIVNKGGTSSSKTYSILQLLLYIAKVRADKGVTISVVSETLPHLKKGAIRDFENILKAENIFDVKQINYTDRIYTFGKSSIEFFSADTAGKATGPRRDILYLNECNNLNYNVVTELEQRTSETIFYDFNPVAPFWIEDKVLTLPSNEFVLLKSNYKDNNSLPESIIREIELKASRDPNYKRIHIDVEYGSYEGVIFPDFELIEPDLFPRDVVTGFGMDFGFTNDPTTLIEVAIKGDNLYLHQHLYQTALTTPEIVKHLKEKVAGRKEVIADSSDPRIIEEIRRAGLNIHPAIKGAGSINQGIDSMKRYNICITKSSTETIKEFRNYKWKEDSSGKMLNEPIDFWNHAIDAARYRSSHIIIKPPLKKARFTF